MDWTQALTIILSTFGMLLIFFFYIMGRMDSNKKDTDQKIEASTRDLRTEMNQRFSEANKRVDDVKLEMNQRFSEVGQRLTSMESHIIFRGIPHHDEAKEE